MTAPSDPQRLNAVTGMATRLQRIDRLLASLDARQAASGRAGVVINYVGVYVPPGILIADGSIVSQVRYPRLFAAIGASFNTGGEGSGNFRLPNYTTPPEHGVWAITT